MIDPGFYAYFINAEIKENLDGFDDEPIGTADRMIWRDLKTVKGAVRRIQNYKVAKTKAWKIFSFTNFHDRNSFKLVAHKTKAGIVYVYD